MSEGRPLRILLLGLNFAPESTGIPKYTAEMAEWLAAAGHSVESIAGLPHYPAWRIHDDYAGKGYHHETIGGVEVFRTPLRMPRGETVRSRDRIMLEASFLFFSFPLLLKRCFPRRRYDAIVCICPPMQSVVAAYLFSLIHGAPLVVHVQDLQVDAAVNLGMLPGGAIARLLLGIERFLFRRSALVSTITEQMRQRVIAKGVASERVTLVPNWANIEDVQPAERMNLFRTTSGWSESEIVVGFSGSLGEKHGLERVLEAAQILADRPAIRFVIIGEGSARGRLIRLAEELRLENLGFLPMQPKATLAEVLSAIDIHLVPQQPDAADTVMPSKLTNILAAGRPTVATALPGTAIAELIAGQRLGAVCEPGNARALADTIASLADDPERRTKFGQRARAFAELNLRQDTIMRRFLSQLQSLVD